MPDNIMSGMNSITVSMDLQLDAAQATPAARTGPERIGTELASPIDVLLAETYLSFVVHGSQYRTTFEISDCGRRRGQHVFRTRHWSTVPRSGEASGRRPAISTAVGPLFPSQTLALRGAGALALDSGDNAAFDVFAPADGYCTVHADYASTASGTLGLAGDTAVTPASSSGSPTDKTLKLGLSAGNNRIAAVGPSSDSLTLRDLRVTSGVDTTGATTYQAEAATRAGAAAVANNTWASRRQVRRQRRQRLGRHPRLPGARPCGRALRDERALRQQPGLRVRQLQP
ncbi:hypothetical protein [Streptomyces stelliscabiei]|uniref:hypothetical protein n=1 Tax=Streptomyces stelliscabiei TaxID=146820 RepID=UPI002FF0ED7A